MLCLQLYEMDFILKKKNKELFTECHLHCVFYASVQMLGNNRFKFLQEVRGEGLS